MQSKECRNKNRCILLAMIAMLAPSCAKRISGMNTFWVLFSFFAVGVASAATSEYNVRDYGAVGDGTQSGQPGD